MILKAEVMPSQRLNENPHLPWIAIKSRWTSVETAHCTCMEVQMNRVHTLGYYFLNQKQLLRLVDVACTWNQDFLKKSKAR